MHHFFYLHAEFLFLKQNITCKYKRDYKCCHTVYDRTDRIYRRIQHVSGAVSKESDHAVQKLIQIYVQIIQPRAYFTVELSIDNSIFLVAMRFWETPVLIPNTMVKT